MNEIIIRYAEGSSRFSKNWKNKKSDWLDFAKMFRAPKNTGLETLAEYKKLSRDEQTQLKDVGGYVGGEVNQKRRDNNTIRNRSLLTLDMDNLKAEDVDIILTKLKEFDYKFLIHSTRKHEPEAPRLRLLMPLATAVDVDKYEPIARGIASIIGIEYFDPSTFEVARLMFYPSICKDAEYFFIEGGSRVLDGEAILRIYRDWRDISEWASETAIKEKTDKKDPRSFQYPIGEFCTAYPVERCLSEFFSDIYEASNREGRYSYTKGSTKNGARIFARHYFYSDHATDPLRGKALNAFELVKELMFNGNEQEAADFVSSLEEVKALATKKMFGDKITEDSQKEAQKLKRNKAGLLLVTPVNLDIIFKLDSYLKDHIYYDEFKQRILFEVGKSCPWARTNNRELDDWRDTDTSQLSSYIEKNYQMAKVPAIDALDAAVGRLATNNKKHPLLETLHAVKWDGVKRVASVFTEFLGAEDTVYTRAVTELFFRAAYGRVYKPGCKFDDMIVVKGEQGIGKSTLFRKLAISDEYFLDSIQKFQGREPMEAIIGKWIVEAPEMQGLNKEDTNTMKAFLSKSCDDFRMSYGKRSTQHQRTCVFVSTTNDETYLRDHTGNRRFLPIDCKGERAVKNPITDLTKDYVLQLWAEARELYKKNDNLYLTGEAKAMLNEIQEAHYERDEWQGLIERYLDTPLPADWDKLGYFDRRNLLNGAWDPSFDKDKATIRDKVCIAEIMSECLGMTESQIDTVKRRRVAKIMDSLEGWARAPMQRYSLYGRQKTWKRKKHSEQPTIQVIDDLFEL